VGTNGIWGFRVEDIDKVTYIHSDSGPDGAGEEILKYVAGRSDKKLRDTARKIDLINGRMFVVSPELKRLFPEGHDDMEARPDIYDGDFRHMADSYRLMFEGTTEWAYLINTDKSRLEVYNSNYDKGARGRYAQFTFDGENVPELEKAYGVALITEIAFDTVRQNEGNFSRLIRRIEGRSRATSEERGIQRFVDHLMKRVGT